jgi:hypothetical protein
MIQMGFVLGIYNAQSIGIWELSQNGNLFHLNLSTTKQSLGIFGLKEDHVFYF